MKEVKVINSARDLRRLIVRGEEIQKAIEVKQAARERKITRKAKRADSFATLGDLLKGRRLGS